MQVNNNNKNLGFSAIKCDPKGMGKDVQKAIVEILPEMRKPSRLYNIDILHHSPAESDIVQVSRTKKIGGIEIKGVSWRDFNNCIATKEKAKHKFESALKSCNGAFRSEFQKAFGTKEERALKNPEAYFAKLDKQRAHAEKLADKPIEFNYYL